MKSRPCLLSTHKVCYDFLNIEWPTKTETDNSLTFLFFATKYRKRVLAPLNLTTWHIIIGWKDSPKKKIVVLEHQYNEANTFTLILGTHITRKYHDFRLASSIHYPNISILHNFYWPITINLPNEKHLCVWNRLTYKL